MTFFLTFFQLTVDSHSFLTDCVRRILQFSILCVAYNPFHKELYSGSQDCLIKAWDAQTGQLLRKLSGHGGWVTDLLFVPELRLLFSCSIDHTIRVWSDKGKQAQVDTIC